MRITLRQLTYLQAVAETGHFGRAAERCSVSQPALSVQIKQLEDALGIQLFERRSQGALLTAQGSEIVSRANDILLQMRDLIDSAHQARPSLSGELRLGVIPTIAPYLLPHALPALTKMYPDLRLRLRESRTSTLLRELASGQLDAILCALPIEANDIDIRTLASDEFLLALPATHPLAGAAQVDMAALKNERILLLEEGHCFRDQALSFCAQADPQMIEGFGATSFATIMQMVGAGYGVTFLPRMAVAAETNGRDELKVLPFAGPVPQRSIGLAWRKASPRHRDFLALSTLLSQVAARRGCAPCQPAAQL